jgi:hypothetical protein
MCSETYGLSEFIFTFLWYVIVVFIKLLNCIFVLRFLLE